MPAEITLWVILGLVVWTIVFPRYLLPSLLIGGLLLGISILRKNNIRITPIDLPIVILLCLLPINLLITPTPQETAPQVHRLVLGILLCYAVIFYVRDTSRLETLFDLNRFLVLGLSIYGLFTIEDVRQIFSTFLPDSLDSLLYVINDTVNANVLAGSLIVLLPQTLAELPSSWNHQKTYQRIFSIISIGAGLGLLGLSQSRGAVIAFVFSVIAMMAVRWRKGRLVAVALTVAMVGFIISSGLPRLLEFVANNPGLTGLPGRTEIWRNSIIIIQDFPFTGVGMGSFPYVIDHLYPILYTLPQRVQHAHNIYLQIGADLGMVGLVAWLGIVFAVAGGDLRVTMSRAIEKDPIVTAAAVGCLGGLTALLAHGFFDSVTWGMVRPAPLVWLNWGIGISAYLLFTKAKSTEVA